MKPILSKAILFLLVALLCSSAAHAALVAVSQMGYHPSGTKQVVVYTSVTNGTFEVRSAWTNAVVFAGSLAKATDNAGNAVNCQGNNPCLVGDFSSFAAAGTYYVRTNTGDTSPQFNISAAVYSSNVPTLLEFYDAQLQKSSAYHENMHAGHSPDFTMIADGSFIMEANQATLTLIRLGSAYRRNPQLFSSDKYAIYAPGKPDMIEHIRSYVEYLKGLQGLSIQERTDGVGFRLNPSVHINNAFVPGPTSRTSLDVYAPGSPPTLIQTVPVVSLCGPDNGLPAWDACMADAALYFKCQADEPCLNMSYTEKTGTVLSNSNGFAISRGWGYEFGCFADVHLNEGFFNDRIDPCLVFYPETSRQYTVETLLGYLEALPAIDAYSQAEGQALFDRAVLTYRYVKTSYPPVTGSEESGFWGTSLFLLYDYTGNVSYLQEAHAIRAQVGTTLVSDKTHGNEFYWEEYVRHKTDITAAGLGYAYNAQDPEDFFRGKIFNDWKDRGSVLSISRTGERVFQFDPNIQFQNSRYMLTEGLFAAKAHELHPAAEPFIRTVADFQLAWLTGMNGVQDGVALGSPVKSFSFIFGIGNQPEQFHSRYLIKTGHRQASGGRISGARGTGYQFKDGSQYVYLDGSQQILGSTMGSLGNGWHGETAIVPFVVGQPFKNGLTYIPGWINGAFDTVSDTDVIYNYRDNLNTYEFTESTNEIVGSAVELSAYLDGQRNGRPRAAQIRFNFTGNGSSPAPPPPNTTNTTTNSSSCFSRVVNIPANCTGGAVTSDTNSGSCRTLLCEGPGGNLQVLACEKPDGTSSPTRFEMYRQSGTGSSITICLGSACMSDNGFAQADFPVCIGNGTAPPPNTTNQTNTTPPAPQNISFASTSPAASTIAIAEPNNQTFSYVLSNPGNLTTSTIWLLNGAAQPASGNAYTFLGNYSTAGVYNVTTRVLSGANNLTRSWTLAVGDTPQAPPPNATNTTTCFARLQGIPANCTGTMTQDTNSGSCRTLLCSSGANSLKVLACEKPDGTSSPTRFEMYKQSQTGSGARICIGTACLQSQGFVQANLPMCVGNGTAPPPPAPQNISFTTTTPSASTATIAEPSSQTFSYVLSNPSSLSTTTQWILNGIVQAATGASYTFPGSFTTNGTHNVTTIVTSSQNTIRKTWTLTVNDTPQAPPPNTTNGTSVTLSIAPWFPQGRSYVFVCNATGFTPTSYDWVFGDGNKQLNSANKDVYYTYAASGPYTVQCTAKSPGTTGTAMLPITVS
jgi:hypothetical protein